MQRETLKRSLYRGWRLNFAEAERQDSTAAQYTYTMVAGPQRFLHELQLLV
jgi:hypothetical protein